MLSERAVALDILSDGRIAQVIRGRGVEPSLVLRDNRIVDGVLPGRLTIRHMRPSLGKGGVAARSPELELS